MKQVTLTQLEALEIATTFNMIKTFVDVINEHQQGSNDDVKPEEVLANIRQLASEQHKNLMDIVMEGRK